MKLVTRGMHSIRENTDGPSVMQADIDINCKLLPRFHLCGLQYLINHGYFSNDAMTIIEGLKATMEDSKQKQTEITMKRKEQKQKKKSQKSVTEFFKPAATFNTD